jgi:outer membrane protein
MNMKLHILSALLVALPLSGFAQTSVGSTSQAASGAPETQTEPAHVGPWSLADCIDYALSHNITVQQQDISMQQKAIDLNTAQNALLPDLSAGASQNLSFGRGLSSENTYVNTNTASTGANLGSSVNLFNGFRAMQTIKLDQINLKAATADLEKAKNDIRMNVAQAYVQILYDMEISGRGKKTDFD